MAWRVILLLHGEVNERTQRLRPEEMRIEVFDLEIPQRIAECFETPSIFARAVWVCKSVVDAWIRVAGR